MKDVYLAASVRTPIGRFGGTLASWTAADLGVAAAKASLERAQLRPDQIQQSIWAARDKPAVDQMWPGRLLIWIRSD